MPLVLRGVLMSYLSLAFGAGASAADTERLLTDFADASPVRWSTVNDNVMGGRSQGGFRIEEGVLVFTGSTNTVGGGFSSIRSRTADFDLSGFDGIRLRLRADGRRYTFRLTTSTTKRGRSQPSYWAEFETTKGTAWEVVDVPFERFRPQWRGRRLDGPELERSKIDSLGLMIYDKRDGPFRLEADWIRAYRSPSPFAMSAYRGKRRPLLVFAPGADDARLVRQLAAIEKTRGSFDERDMELLVVLGKGASRAGSMVLRERESRALQASYGVETSAFAVRLVGKDGGVKRASDDVVDPHDLYALIDSMPMRKREVRERKTGP